MQPTEPTSLVARPTGALVAGSAALVILAVAVVALDDPLGLLLVGTAVVAVLVFVAGDLAARPAVVADGQGIVLRTGLRRKCFTWSEHPTFSAAVGRGGLGGVLLCDVGDELAVIPQRRLGMSAADAASLLQGAASNWSSASQ